MASTTIAMPPRATRWLTADGDTPRDAAASAWVA